MSTPGKHTVDEDITETFKKRFLKKGIDGKWHQGVQRTTIAIGIVFLTSYASICLFCIYAQTPMRYFVAVPFLACINHMMYYVQHEALHGNISGTSWQKILCAEGEDHWLDKWSGEVAAWLRMDVYEVHKAHHRKHHQFVNKKNDPDILIAGKFSVLLAVWMLMLLGSFIDWIPYLNSIVAGWFKVKLEGRFKVELGVETQKTNCAFSMRFLQVAVAIVLALACGWEKPLLLWWMPSQFGNFGRLFFAGWMPHHGMKDGLWNNARITLFHPWVNALLSFFVFGGHNYHLLHHRFPYVPACEFPAFFEEVRDLLENKNIEIDYCLGAKPPSSKQQMEHSASTEMAPITAASSSEGVKRMFIGE